MTTPINLDISGWFPHPVKPTFDGLSPTSARPVVSTTWLGIPNPDWPDIGNPTQLVAPARPSDWSSEVAGHYYISWTTGTDSGRTYGTPTAPRQSIPSSPPAGSRIEVAGNYNKTSGGDIRINSLGTSADPVWIISDVANRAVFTPSSKILVYGTYLFLDDIEGQLGTGARGIQVSSSSAGFSAGHICLRNSEMIGNVGSTSNLSLVSMVTSSGDPVSDIVIHNNLLRDNGPTVDVDQDNHIVTVSSYLSNIWITNNTLRNSAGSGMQFGASAPGPTFVYAGGNEVDNSRQSGIWVKYGKDIIVSDNLIHDIQDRCVGSDTSPSKGLGAQFSPVRVWWLRNTVYNCRYGLRVPSTDSNNTVGEYYALGNTFRDIDIAPSSCAGYPTGTNAWDMAAIHMHGGSIRHIINNVIIRCSSGIHLSREATTEVIQNNITYDINHTNGYHLYVDNNGASFDPDYNIHNTETGNAIKWGSTTYATLAAFVTAKSKSSNSLSSDPTFVNAAANNFRLVAGSPAINAGVTPTAYDTFNTLYGIDIKKDIDDVARPNGVWDIGIHEAA